MPHYRGEERWSSASAVPVRYLRKDGNIHGRSGRSGGCGQSMTGLRLKW